ncbi:DNA helicase Pif1-like, partial [Trinorchestia longiramus]
DTEAETRFFFLAGPGGSGKTYLYNTLTYIKSQGKTVLPFATTGIAADLLSGGRTVHNGFKIPVPVLDTSLSRIRIPFEDSAKLLSAVLIIIDEASILT